MKGKFPVTKIIKLTSNTDQWELVEKRLINELPCSGLVERSEDSTVKIQVVITDVASPKRNRWQGNTKVSGAKSQELNHGIERIKNFFDDLYNQNIWILAGYIDGDNKTPILILYYEIFEISVYTIKFKEESYADFLPEGVLPPKEDEE